MYDVICVSIKRSEDRDIGYNMLNISEWTDGKLVNLTLSINCCLNTKWCLTYPATCIQVLFLCFFMFQYFDGNDLNRNFCYDQWTSLCFQSTNSQITFKKILLGSFIILYIIFIFSKWSFKKKNNELGFHGWKTTSFFSNLLVLFIIFCFYSNIHR